MGRDLDGDVPAPQEGPGRKGHIPTAPKWAGAGLRGVQEGLWALLGQGRRMS